MNRQEQANDDQDDRALAAVARIVLATPPVQPRPAKDQRGGEGELEDGGGGHTPTSPLPWEREVPARFSAWEGEAGPMSTSPFRSLRCSFPLPTERETC